MDSGNNDGVLIQDVEDLNIDQAQVSVLLRSVCEESQQRNPSHTVPASYHRLAVTATASVYSLTPSTDTIGSIDEPFIAEQITREHLLHCGLPVADSRSFTSTQHLSFQEHIDLCRFGSTTHPHQSEDLKALLHPLLPWASSSKTTGPA